MRNSTLRITNSTVVDCLSVFNKFRNSAVQHWCRMWLEYLLFSKSSRTYVGCTQLSIQWIQGLSAQRVKRPGCDADNSSPFISEVKIKRSNTSTPLVYLHGVERENVIFYLYPIILIFTKSHFLCNIVPTSFFSNSIFVIILIWQAGGLCSW